ncbi:MAG: ribulose-phosphate 3-epimerase [Phycisphaerales bacterium]|jgi:ribulose-phosphate 3-epimerase|nr:ribulose-phosphate 3-epimerase [Phycisphaerales bacterium]
MPHPFRSPRTAPLVSASILSADFMRMGEDARAVLDAGADMLHVDVMDGHFVPNLTMGPDMVRGLRRTLPSAFLDVHVMVDDPLLLARAFADAGANHLTFHAEAAAAPARALRIAEEVRATGMSVGLAINPPTVVEPWLDCLGSFDLALVMSIHPGFSGQRFIPSVLDKARAIRARYPALAIEVDGGVGPAQSGECIRAGIDVLAAATAIFSRPASERPEVIRSMRSAR